VEEALSKLEKNHLNLEGRDLFLLFFTRKSLHRFSKKDGFSIRGKGKERPQTCLKDIARKKSYLNRVEGQ